MLVNSNYMDNQFFLTVGMFVWDFSKELGVGVNLWNDQPSACINTILRSHAEKSKLPIKEISMEEMLALVMNKWEEFYQIFEKDGFTPFHKLYYKYWLHRYVGRQGIPNSFFSNEKVNLDTGNGLVEVTIQGITDNGFLLAAGDDKYYELHPDGNSFDLMHGLISQKKSTL